MSRRKTHTEKWWDAAPPHILRCTGHNKGDGSRCRAEAAAGTTVCDRHGALIPVVQRAAANRIQMSVDEAAKQLVEWMNDPKVDMRERVKIAHDLLDRGGMAPTSRHLIGVVGGNDPIETLFRDLLSDPDATYDPRAVQAETDPYVLELNRQADPQEDDDPDFEDLIGGDVVDAELVEDEPTPARPSHTRQVTERMSSTPPKHLREALEMLQ